MKRDLIAEMKRATILTRAGDMRGATNAIRQALGAARGSQRCGVPDDSHQVCEEPVRFDPRVVSIQQPMRHADNNSCLKPDSSDERRFQAPMRAHFMHRDIDMDYRLYSPKPGKRPAPLLVLLHGCTQDSDDFAVGTDMDAVAATAGVHVLYPSQSGMRNPRKCWNWFEPAHQKRGAGEVAALHALTAEIACESNVDESCVFVAGMSAGGAMALVLADQYPETFSGVGVHSGLPCDTARGVSQALAAMRGERSPTPPHRAKNSVPLIVFHGSADPVVHPSNAAHIVAARVAHETITVKSDSGVCNGRDYKRHLHCTSEGRVVCEHWDLIGGAHQWSGGNPAGSHTVSDGPDASAEMLRFFMESVPER